MTRSVRVFRPVLCSVHGMVSVLASEVDPVPPRLARLGGAQAGQDGEDQRQRRHVAVFSELLDQLGNVLPSHGGMIVAMDELAGLSVALHGGRVAELGLEPA